MITMILLFVGLPASSFKLTTGLQAYIISLAIAQGLQVKLQLLD